MGGDWQNVFNDRGAILALFGALGARPSGTLPDASLINGRIYCAGIFGKIYTANERLALRKQLSDIARVPI